MVFLNHRLDSVNNRQVIRFSFVGESYGAPVNRRGLLPIFRNMYDFLGTA